MNKNDKVDMKEYNTLVTENLIKQVQDEAAAKIEHIKSESVRKEQRRTERAEAAAELKLKLEDEHGVQINPKRDLLWAKAWELGHSAGLQDVDIYYSDLVDLIK